MDLYFKKISGNLCLWINIVFYDRIFLEVRKTSLIQWGKPQTWWKLLFGVCFWSPVVNHTRKLGSASLAHGRCGRKWTPSFITPLDSSEWALSDFWMRLSFIFSGDKRHSLLQLNIFKNSFLRRGPDIINKDTILGIHILSLDNTQYISISLVIVKSLSRVRLFATPWTVAHQAPLSVGFSRQEYWSVLPFPSPGDLPDPGIKPGSPAL